MNDILTIIQDGFVPAYFGVVVFCTISLLLVFVTAIVTGEPLAKAMKDFLKLLFLSLIPIAQFVVVESCLVMYKNNLIRWWKA